VEGGIELRLNPKADTAIDQMLTGVIDITQTPEKNTVSKDAIGTSKISMEYSIRVAHADAGSVFLDFSSSPLAMEGKAKGAWEQLGGQRAEIRFDRRAALLEDPSSLFEGLFGTGMLMFPQSKIAPGSVWSAKNTRDMPPFGPVHITETFTYKGLEQKRGIKVHHIESVGSGSLEGMTMKGTYFIREDGLPHSATISTKASSPIAVDANDRKIWADFRVVVRTYPK
jgi:hypothetical protein